MLNGCHICKEEEEEEEIIDRILLYLLKGSHLVAIDLRPMDPLLGRGGRKFEELFLYTYFGPYGRREIKGCLKFLKKQIKQSNNPSFIIFGSELEYTREISQWPWWTSLTS